MRRIAPTIPVSPGMLRHFAVITVVITAGLAMFASGENRAYVEEQVQHQELKAQEVRTERERSAKHTVVIDGLRLAPGTRLAPAEVDSPSFVTDGAPVSMDNPALTAAPLSPYGTGGPGTAYISRNASGTVNTPPAAQMRMRRKPGPANAQTPALAPGPPRPTQQQVDAIEAASAQRASMGVSSSSNSSNSDD